MIGSSTRPTNNGSGESRLRRHAAIAGGDTDGSSPCFRLDPFRLPVQFTTAVDGMEYGRSTVTLDRDRATIVQPASDGSLTTKDVPITSYLGVAVRIFAESNGGASAVVELMHRNPTLSLPLVLAEEPEDAAADWQAWARALNLPLLLVGHDGAVQKAAERPGAVLLLRAKPRRRHAFFAGRRPRFLARRKPGRPGLPVRVEGREIIARD